MGGCGADPADQPASRRPALGLGHPCHRRKPVVGPQADGRRLDGLDLRLGLHALLCDQFHLYRPRRGDRHPCAPVQHRRRGPSDAGRPRRGADRALYTLAALEPRASGRRGGRGTLRRGLGSDPGLASGQARQPHRDHHDHVQLHRRGAAELPADRRAQTLGLDGARHGPLPRGHASADLPGHVLDRRDRAVPGRAGERVVLRGAAGLRRRLGADLAHPSGL